MTRTGWVVALAVLLLAVSPATAADKTWTGVNSTAATDISQTDVDNSDLWSGGLPTTDDTAVFDFRTGSAPTLARRLVIDPTGPFNPGGLFFNCSSWQSPYVPIYLQRDLTLSQLKLVFGFSSGGQGYRAFRIGSSAEKASIQVKMNTSRGTGDDNVAAVEGDVIITGNAGSALVNMDGLTEWGEGVNGAYQRQYDIRDRINAQSVTTGVVATTGGSNASGWYYLHVYLNSADAGSDQFVKVEPQKTRATFAVNRFYHAGTATTKASITLNAAGVATADGKVRIRGNKTPGVAYVTFANPESAESIVDKINAVSDTTGVTALTDGTDVTIESELMGTSEYIRLVRMGGFQTQSSEGYGTGILTEDYGLDAETVTLTLTGTIPVDLARGLSGSIQTRWASIELAPGCVMDFTNTALNLAAQTQDAGSANAGAITGSGGVVKVSGSGTVSLEHPGIRSDGNLNLGAHELKVRSSQTWTNCESGVGYVRRTVAPSIEMVGDLDSAALDNLGNLPFFVDHSSSNIYQGSAMEIRQGKYQSIAMQGYYTSGRENWVKLTGDVELTGSCVIPGDNSGVWVEADPDYSLITFGQSRAQFIVNLNGNALTTELGVLLKRDAGAGSQYDTQYNMAYVEAKNSSTLNVAGDLVFDEVWRYAGHKNSAGTAFIESRDMGINGDATTVVNLASDFETNVRSMSGSYNGLTLSTVNLVGGTGLDPNTFEVGADRDDEFALATYCVGELNIGDGTAAGVIKLINETLNDNNPLDLGKTKEGEVLLAKMLNVKAGSTLDCNLATGPNPDGAGGVKLGAKALSILRTSGASGTVNIEGNRGSADVGTSTNINTMMNNINAVSDLTGVRARLSYPGSTGVIDMESEFPGATEFVKITKGAATFNATPLEAYGTEGLSVAPTGTLDLSTGGPLNAGDKVLAFCGMGDRTTAWNTFKDRVVDTDNPLLGFEAVTTTLAFEVGGAPTDMTVTVWQATSGGVLEITGASISPDWAFQNTASTVVNVHYGLLTVTVNDTYGNNSYTVTVTKTAGPGEVTVGAGANDLEKRLYGSLRTDGITGTGTCQFSVQVVGDVGGDVTGPVSTTFKVRKLGDINDDNAVTTDDSVWLTKKLNNLDVTPLVQRDFDVTGDGFVTTDDDVLLTKILNNLAIP